MGKQSGYPIWLWAICIVVGANALIGSCKNESNTASTHSFTPSNKEEEFGHRYVKERIKLEGYNDKEASDAANAIMKFQRAQEQRKNR